MKTCTLYNCTIEPNGGTSLLDITVGTNRKKSHETYRLSIADIILGQHLLLSMNIAVMRLLTVIIDVN